MRRLILALSSLHLAACGSCSKSDTPKDADATDGALVTKDVVPRCRGEAQRHALPAEDIVVGDVAIGPAGLLVGLVRTPQGGGRTMSVMRLSSDLATSSIVDLGRAYGDDPPPSPRWNDSVAYAAVVTRLEADGSSQRPRVLHVVRLDEKKTEATIAQQADESTAFDVAWNEKTGLVAWDEDAPFSADASVGEERGFVKVQGMAEGAPRRVASPETSDAESPRLLPRPGGYWLAWLARRPEHESEQHHVEGPGEKRSFRWVEIVPLDLRGAATAPVRRVTPEKGRVLGFELAADPQGGVVVMAQDETASAEGSSARIVRHLVGDKIVSAELVTTPVGHAMAELVPIANANEPLRWLAWTDPAEHMHMTPLGPGLVPSSGASLEPALDGARVLSSTGDGVWVLTGMAPERDHPQPHPEIRRFVCR